MLTGRFFFTTAYGVGSFFIYTLIIRMMFKRWFEYKATFFKLYIAEFFFNLITFVNSFITLRAPQNTCNDCIFSFLFETQNSPEKHVFPLNFFFTIHYSMAFIQYSMTFLISLNRLTMVILITNYESYWRHTYLFFLVVIAVFPFTQTWPIFVNNAYYFYIPGLQGYGTRTMANAPEIIDFLLMFMAIITLLTAVVNILSIFRLICLADRIAGAEKNLFQVSFVSFIIQVLAAGNTLLVHYAVTDANPMSQWLQYAQYLMPFVSDLLTVSHPWTLLYFSSKVRSSMMQHYLPHRNGRLFSSSGSSVLY